jgi:hypothetical protein
MNKMIYKEILNELNNQLSGNEKVVGKINKARLHLGVFAEPYLSLMLKGDKTIESRFSKNKIMPYNSISNDDIVIVKKSGSDIVALFTAKKVLSFDLSVTSINEIRDKYQTELCVSDEFWEQKENSNYATLIFIDEIIKLKPFHINKKGMQTWIILNHE